MLVLRRLAIIPTLKCTLNCKLCCNSVPLYHNPPYLPTSELFDDIRAVFELVDRIEWIQLVGGELFMHPDIGEIIANIYQYRAQFDKLILMTNGTLLPKENALLALKKYGEACQVQISDYGKYSYKIRELEKVLTDYGIPHVTKVFHGDMQHYGGWVDNTSYEKRGYSEEELHTLFDSCWQIGMKNYHMYQGKLHNCIRSLFGLDLGLIPVQDGEYVDVRDSSTSREEKRAILEQFNTKPLTACQYCGGFDSKNAKRYPAAEQI